ncbi:spermidine synthase [Alicyclobacillus sp. SO9]|uniref:spermidine synthase n=1 Tax=Alicyclobacillus sp. SO9 TaxID=2665646 RepID=UPI0018E8C785|nr:class I SAM-dependent methyltransferase [Alicyclobacillus sp. SO9]QQE76907.1 class I SAM-dependent methyltransferase [Alicyclobacillus sp. SO9]
MGEIRIQGNVHDIRIVKKGTVTYMRFGLHGGWQGALHHQHPSRPVFPYQRAFAAALEMVGPIHSFLSVGVGTGTSITSVTNRFPESEIYGVDVDEQVIQAAIQYFNAPSYENANYFVGDGLKYIRSSDRKFDLMFLDAYMSTQIYSPVLELDVLQWIDEALAEATGTACFNVISQVPPYGQVKRWWQEAKNRFPSAIMIPVGVPYTSQNTLVILSKSEHISNLRIRSALRHSQILSPWERLTWPLRLRS